MTAAAKYSEDYLKESEERLLHHFRYCLEYNHGQLTVNFNAREGKIEFIPAPRDVTYDPKRQRKK